MPLSKKDAKQIAVLINRVQVSLYLATEANKGGKPWDDYLLWTIAMDEAVIALADQFGIELPNLTHCRERLPQMKAEYAKRPKAAVAA